MAKWTVTTWTNQAPPRDIACGAKTTADEGGASRSTPHEFTANEINRERWTAAFWALFPSGEKAFVELVRTTGISATVTLDFEPEAVVQPEYGGVPTHELSRLLLSDAVSPHLNRLNGLNEVVDEASLARFRRDFNAWQHEYRVAAERCASRLPHPPNGFMWVRHTGGVVLAREVGGWPAAKRLTYRLWRRDLGYMRGSE